MAAAIVIVGAGAIYFGTRDSGAGKPVAVVESAAAAKKDDGQTAAAAAAAKAADVARVEEARRAAREQVLARVSAMGTDADQVARGRLDEEVQQFLAKAAPADRTLVEERWNAVSQAWANARRPATVRVATIPEGAEVRVGEKMLRSPAVLQNLRPGKVRIEVSNAGFKSQTLELDLAPGERLEPPVIALAPITGKVQLMPARPGLRYRLQNPNGSAREGSLPALLELPVGRYPVHYMREGYGSREDTLVVAEAGPGEVTADVVGGSLHLSANLEGVEVSVNGRPVGTAPVEVKDLRPGEHEIEFSKSKFESVKRTRRLELGKELREAATLKPDAVTRFLQKMDGYWVTEWKLGEVRWGLRISAEDRLATMRVAGVFKPTDTKMVLRDFEAAKQRAMIAPGYHELELQGDLLIELSSSRDGLKEVRRYKRANEAEWNKI